MSLSLCVLPLLLVLPPLVRAAKPPSSPPPAPLTEGTVEAARPDRSAPPPVTPPEMMALPTPVQKTLRPGLTLTHLRVEGVRKVEVMVMFHRGSVELCGTRLEPCTLLSQVWDLASVQTDALAMETRLDALDGRLTSWVGQTSSGLELDIPRTALSEGLGLLRETLYTPGLPRDELRRSRKNTLDWYRETAPTELGQISQSARQMGFYAADTAAGARPDLRALKRVRTGALRSLHRTLLETAPVSVLVVGDLPLEEIEAELVGLLEGVGVDAPWAEPEPYTRMGASSVVAVDMPGQQQAAIRLASAAPPRADAAQVPFGAMNFALGGSFTSRLNANLREEKGWTYGAGSRYMAHTTHGAWWVGVDVEAENVAATVAEIRREVAGVRETGVTAGELHSAWLDEITTWNRALETAESAAGLYQSALLQRETVADRAARLEALQRLPPESLPEIGSIWLGESNPQLWVIVGDREKIGAQVEGLGLPVQWITPEDAILGRFSVPR